MPRVVYNNCFGGFGLHEDVVKWVRENRDSLEEEYADEDIDNIAERTISGEYYPDGSGPKREYSTYVHPYRLDRENPLLADIVEGKTEYDGQVSADVSSLRVAEVPDGVEWTIEEYDGSETVRETARTFS